MPGSSIKVVPIGDKICRPFLLDVMVFSPESGYKFKVVVERSCSPEADPVWKLVFDLFRVMTDREVQVVHVSFTAGTPVEQKAIQRMASVGVKPTQATILVDEVHPAAKAIEGVNKPTLQQKQQLHDSMSKVVNVDV
ncbi:MAG: hypothetical protein HXX11_21150 [Desulfuromonadales bacterium]|nr:hypothetical protein [Desulfuromonadales bacterium]